MGLNKIFSSFLSISSDDHESPDDLWVLARFELASPYKTLSSSSTSLSSRRASSNWLPRRYTRATFLLILHVLMSSIPYEFLYISRALPRLTKASAIWPACSYQVLSWVATPARKSVPWNFAVYSNMSSAFSWCFIANLSSRFFANTLAIWI